MRSLVLLLCLSTGCFGYLGNDKRPTTITPRQEGGQILKIGLITVAAGAALGTGSYLLFDSSPRASENGGKADGTRILGLLGLIASGLMVAGGTGDTGIGIYQLISGTDPYDREPAAPPLRQGAGSTPGSASYFRLQE